MSSLNLDTWSTTPASNNAATPNGAPEGQAPSTLNDCMRQFMACVVTYSRSLPTAAGTANAQTLVNAIPQTVLVAGYVAVFLPVAANTGPWTFAPDGLTAKNVFANGAACAGGEVQTNVPAWLKYDGTQWNLLNPLAPGKNFLIDPCCRVAQGDGTTTLTTSYKYGKVDLVNAKGSGTAVNAGTITQDTAGTLASGATLYSCKLAGCTITGTGKVFFRKFIESRDAAALNGQTVLFSVYTRQDTGGAINGFLTLNKFNSADNNSAVTLLATGSTVSVANTADTLVTVAYTFGASDGSNGVELILELDCGAVTTKNFYATDWQSCIKTLAQKCVVPRFEDDLAAVFRYFEKSYEYGTVVGSAVTTGQTGFRLGSITWQTAQTQKDIYPRFRTPKLAAPTVTLYSPSTGASGKFFDSTAAADKTCTVASDVETYVITQTSGGTLAAGDAIQWHFGADARL